MTWALWASGILAGLAFAAGILIGAWMQRKMPIVVKDAKTPLRTAFDKNPMWGKTNNEVPGTEHPAGPPPPSPDKALKARRSQNIRWPAAEG